MHPPADFEQMIADLMASHERGGFGYADPKSPFRGVVCSHLSSREATYGVYVLRKETSREVIYIGKGGTVDANGGFKGQDLRGRLKNVRAKDTPADVWFSGLVQKHGPLTIEYIVLSKDLSPGFVEAILLQAYLNDHGRLPAENRSL
ncbi:MAG: hypothetical protein ACLQNE_40520 [Thermoguttaceae bacterium]